MTYMLLVYSEEGQASEFAATMQGCLGLADQLEAKGQYYGGSPLHPTDTATVVKVREGRRLVTDGPFAETREALAGYMLVEARDLDEALAIAAQHPVAAYGTLEVRPVLQIPASKFTTGEEEVRALLASTSDLTVVASGDVAFAHGHTADARVTYGLRREGGRWQLLHEHRSPVMPTQESHQIALSRRFNASRETLYRLTTEAEWLPRWWVENPGDMTVHEEDARPGGRYRYTFRLPDGNTMEMSGEYQEVTPNRIVRTQECGGETCLDTVEFDEVGNGTEVRARVDFPRDPGDTSPMEAGMRDCFDRLERLAAQAPTAGSTAEPCFGPPPGAEHQWLQQLVGTWRGEGAGAIWTEVVRPLGPYFIVIDAQGEMPGAEPGETRVILGFDPRTNRYVGSWAGSMMAHYWVYDGEREGDALALYAEGPAMDDSGGTDRYRDVLQLEEDGRWLWISSLWKDGEWQEFMRTVHVRTEG